VVYRQFPDPHAGDGTLLGPAIDGPVSHAGGGQSVSHAGGSQSAPSAGGGLSAEGRHTVPDELVQAATYRLPPDRVFRAKVPDSALPEEPTTRLSVPKPRQS
jgi:hypothetical protein